MTIDLRDCVPGQLVKLRDGRVVEYRYRSIEAGKYPHRVGDSFYTDGGYYFACREEDEIDVVQILSFHYRPILSQS